MITAGKEIINKQNMFAEIVAEKVFGKLQPDAYRTAWHTIALAKDSSLRRSFTAEEIQISSRIAFRISQLMRKHGDDMIKIVPLIEKQLQDPYKGKLINLVFDADIEESDLIDLYSGNIQPIKEEFNAANKLLHEYFVQAWTEYKQKPEPVQITKQGIDNIVMSMDKPTRAMFNLFLDGDSSGIINLDIDTERNTNGKAAANVSVLCSINYTELEQDIKTRYLTPYDKRILEGVNSLYNAGITVFSLTQLYKVMGYSSTPKQEELNRLSTELTKMRATTIKIDNSKEIAAGYKYPLFKYDDTLLAFARVKAIINGKETIAIKLHNEPPLLRFAKGRRQITALDPALRQSTLSKTDFNIQLEDYLDYRIAADKREELVILFSTIKEHINFSADTSDAAKKQAFKSLSGRVKKYLDHYKKLNKIKDFTVKKDKVIIKQQS